MKYKRVNILLTQEQYEAVQARGLSLSGLVRDLITDRFSNTQIVLSVPPEIRALYDKLVSNFGVGDQDLAPYLLETLEKFLQSKTSEIESFRHALKDAHAELIDRRAAQKE